jgi:hypothetical protein
MIRATCAWALLLLAASPFTAPYSTCDLRAFFVELKPAQVLSLGQAQTCIGVASATSDADAVSPVVARTQLQRDAALPLIESPVPRRINHVGFRRLPPADLNRSPHHTTSQPTVLRL